MAHQYSGVRGVRMGHGGVARAGAHYHHHHHHHHAPPAPEVDNGPESQLFDQFCAANTLQGIMSTFQQLCDSLDLKPSDHCNFYRQLKSRLNSWKANVLWSKLDKRVAHREYKKGTACSNTRVLIIGAGPCGLRIAIELALLGAKAVVMEKRDRFSRNNVLHLWPYLIHDLKMLGAKKFFGKFCAGAIDHISIRALQCILLKAALLVGVEVHVNVSFEGLVDPPPDQSQEKMGWRAKVLPEEHPLSEYEFEVLVGADGKRNTLTGFKRKEFRGKLAIAITANFINRNSQMEARVEEISGVAFIFNQKFFKDLHEKTGIDLENIVYYKDDTHYFVMTAKKQSLLEKGVLIWDLADTAQLLGKDNVNQDALMLYAREAAEVSTNYMLPNLEYAHNHYGQPDVAMFDFTSIYAAEHASRVVERNGHKLLLALVGDSLLEPFWPTGSGCARGFLGALDAAWMIRSWASGKMTPLEVMAERESVYQLLSQTNNDNLHKNFNQYTVDPNTRYRNLNCQFFKPCQVRHQYVGGDVKYLDEIVQISEEKSKKYEWIRDSHFLLKWFVRQLEPYKNRVKILDLTSTWRNGVALCCLIHKYHPELIDINILDVNEVSHNNQVAFDIAEKEFGITPVMSGQDMAMCEVPDKLTMVSYLSQFYEYFRKESIRPAKMPCTPENLSIAQKFKAPRPRSPSSRLSILSRISNRIRQRRLGIGIRAYSVWSSSSSEDLYYCSIEQEQGDKENDDSDSDARGRFSNQPSFTYGVTRKRVRAHNEESVFLTGYNKLEGTEPAQPGATRRTKACKLSPGVRGKNKVSAMAKDLAVKFKKGDKSPQAAKKVVNPPRPLIMGQAQSADMCYFCHKRVYLVERHSAEGVFFHRWCLKCTYCSSSLRIGQYAFQRGEEGEAKFFCIQHIGLKRPFRRPRKRSYDEHDLKVKEAPEPPEPPDRDTARLGADLQRPKIDLNKTPERIEYYTESEVEESELDQTAHNLRSYERRRHSDSSTESEENMKINDVELRRWLGSSDDEQDCSGSDEVSDDEKSWAELALEYNKRLRRSSSRKKRVVRREKKDDEDDDTETETAVDSSDYDDWETESESETEKESEGEDTDMEIQRRRKKKVYQVSGTVATATTQSPLFAQVSPPPPEEKKPSPVVKAVMMNRMSFFSAPTEPVRIDAFSFLGLNTKPEVVPEEIVIDEEGLDEVDEADKDETKKEEKISEDDMEGKLQAAVIEVIGDDDDDSSGTGSSGEETITEESGSEEEEGEVMKHDIPTIQVEEIHLENSEHSSSESSSSLSGEESQKKDEMSEGKEDITDVPVEESKSEKEETKEETGIVEEGRSEMEDIQKQEEGTDVHAMKEEEKSAKQELDEVEKDKTTYESVKDLAKEEQVDVVAEKNQEVISKQHDIVQDEIEAKQEKVQTERKIRKELATEEDSDLTEISDNSETEPEISSSAVESTKEEKEAMERELEKTEIQLMEERTFEKSQPVVIDEEAKTSLGTSVMEQEVTRTEIEEVPVGEMNVSIPEDQGVEGTSALPSEDSKLDLVESDNGAKDDTSQIEISAINEDAKVTESQVPSEPTGGEIQVTSTDIKPIESTAEAVVSAYDPRLDIEDMDSGNQEIENNVEQYSNGDLPLVQYQASESIDNQPSENVSTPNLAGSHIQTIEDGVMWVTEKDSSEDLRDVDIPELSLLPTEIIRDSSQDKICVSNQIDDNDSAVQQIDVLDNESENRTLDTGEIENPSLDLEISAMVLENLTESTEDICDTAVTEKTVLAQEVIGTSISDEMPSVPSALVETESTDISETLTPVVQPAETMHPHLAEAEMPGPIDSVLPGDTALTKVSPVSFLSSISAKTEGEEALGTKPAESSAKIEPSQQEEVESSTEVSKGDPTDALRRIDQLLEGLITSPDSTLDRNLAEGKDVLAASRDSTLDRVEADAILARLSEVSDYSVTSTDSRQAAANLIEVTLSGDEDQAEKSFVVNELYVTTRDKRKKKPKSGKSDSSFTISTPSGSLHSSNSSISDLEGMPSKASGLAESEDVSIDELVSSSLQEGTSSLENLIDANLSEDDRMVRGKTPPKQSAAVAKLTLNLLHNIAKDNSGVVDQSQDRVLKGTKKLPKIITVDTTGTDDSRYFTPNASGIEPIESGSETKEPQSPGSFLETKSESSDKRSVNSLTCSDGQSVSPLYSPNRAIDAKRRFFFATSQPVRIDPKSLFGDGSPKKSSKDKKILANRVLVDDTSGQPLMNGTLEESNRKKGHLDSDLIKEWQSLDETSSTKDKTKRLSAHLDLKRDWQSLDSAVLDSSSPTAGVPHADKVNGEIDVFYTLGTSVKTHPGKKDSDAKFKKPSEAKKSKDKSKSKKVLSTEETRLKREADRNKARQLAKNKARMLTDEELGIDDAGFSPGKIEKNGVDAQPSTSNKSSSILRIRSSSSGSLVSDKAESPGDPKFRPSSAPVQGAVPPVSSKNAKSQPVKTEKSKEKKSLFKSQEKVKSPKSPKSQEKVKKEKDGLEPGEKKEKRRSFLAMLRPSKSMEKKDKDKDTKGVRPKQSQEKPGKLQPVKSPQLDEKAEKERKAKDKTPTEKKIPKLRAKLRVKALEKEEKDKHAGTFDEFNPLFEDMFGADLSGPKGKEQIQERLQAVAPAASKKKPVPHIPPKATMDEFDTESEYGDDKSVRSFHASLQNMSHMTDEERTKMMKRQRKAAIRRQKEQELKRLRMAQEIQRQLEEVEAREKDVETKGIAIERSLRGEGQVQETSRNEPQLMQEWFNVVHEKNLLVRYESELMVHARELELEDRHSRLEQQLRELMTIQDGKKNVEEKEEEKRILEELLEVVEQRDALVALLEEDRLRFMSSKDQPTTKLNTI